MVDYFSLALSHGVLLLAFWRLCWRDDLDSEPATRGEGEAIVDKSVRPSELTRRD